MGEKLNSKNTFMKYFYHLLSRFVSVWIKVCKKCYYDQKSFLEKIKKGKKNLEFNVDLKSVEKISKNAEYKVVRKSI
jgi:hypothetical protein